MDRRILRAKAKEEFKKFKKQSQQNKNVPFSAYFDFYKRNEKMKAISGKMKEVAETISLDDEAFLAEVLGNTTDVVEVTEEKTT